MSRKRRGGRVEVRRVEPTFHGRVLTRAELMKKRREGARRMAERAARYEAERRARVHEELKRSPEGCGPLCWDAISSHRECDCVCRGEFHGVRGGGLR